MFYFLADNFIFFVFASSIADVLVQWYGNGVSYEHRFTRLVGTSTSAKQVIRIGTGGPLEPVFETGSKGSVLKGKAFRTGSPQTGSKPAAARPRGCTAARGLEHL